MEAGKEILFARILEKVRKQAKEQGNYIEKRQVEDAFKELSLSQEQLALVFDYLEKRKIGIDTVTDSEELLSEEEINYLEIYKKELELLETLSQGEKEAVTLSAMAGETDAQQRLISVYLPQVVEISKLYSGQGVCLEDLIGEGNVALAVGVTMLGCLEHAGEADGMLAKMIMDAMEECIAEADAESDKDKKVLKKVNRVAKQAEKLSEELRRKVTVSELAAETGMSPDSIKEAMRLSGYTIKDIERMED